MKSRHILAVLLLTCFGCQPPVEKLSTPVQEQSIATDTNVVLKVGVAKDGMLKQQVVHAYKTNKLAEHKLVVRAGATLTILESLDGASLVHFLSEARTPDYKAEIPQAEATGWIANKEIVRINKEKRNAQQEDALDPK